MQHPARLDHTLRRIALIVALACLACAVSLRDQALAGVADKLIVLGETIHDPIGRFKVSPDGSKVYIAAAREFVVVDRQGAIIDRIGVPNASQPRDLIPWPGGGFLACDSYANGHLALCRLDGTEIRTLVGKGREKELLRADSTGWTSPCAAAIDATRKLIYVVDTTQAPAGQPDPDWSRIAIFNFDGRFQGELRLFDAKSAKPDDELRTWYNDIAVDEETGRIFLFARRTQEVIVLDPAGKEVGRLKASGDSDGSGGIAVRPDRTILVGAGNELQVFAPDLQRIRVVPSKIPGIAIRDVEADAAGGVYVTVNDPSILYLRFTPDLSRVDVIGPNYLRVRTSTVDGSLEAGGYFEARVEAAGRPEPNSPPRWSVWTRPCDGSIVNWRRLESTTERGLVRARIPEDSRGIHEFAVRFGDGPIDLANPSHDPHITSLHAIRSPGVSASVAVLSANGRSAFLPGETIPLQVSRRSGTTVERNQRVANVTIRLDLVAIQDQRRITLGSSQVAVRGELACSIPARWTRRLTPGKYWIQPSATNHASIPLLIEMGPGVPDSPMQRVVYREFDTTPATAGQPGMSALAEKFDFIDASLRSLRAQGFTRETDRRLGQLDPATGPIAWRRDLALVDASHPALGVGECLALPTNATHWETEVYLDRATAWGVRYDTQLLPHCSGVRFRNEWFAKLLPQLQRGTQWMGRYPSFLGLNFNDEMFFGGFATEWSPEDDAWIDRLAAQRFKGLPRPTVLFEALRLMYEQFTSAVKLAKPDARLTATPMWQFPAVEGSYAPLIYERMQETYTHFLSEGYHYPWYPAHNAEFLRRPNRGLIAVTDNGQSQGDGAVYLKNVMQTLARGVQGVGVQHIRPFDNAAAADAHRVANRISTVFGPIFAELAPWNEAAVLYSRTQDWTEKRNSLGTPHWERVYLLFGAGLMAGLPMSIVYEEDLAAGALLRSGRPSVPMLFLVGQTEVGALPRDVKAAIDQYIRAGGTVYTDAESSAYPKAQSLPIKTHSIAQELNDGYAADTLFPLLQPRFEKLAADLKSAVGGSRSFACDVDDPWVSVHRFQGGKVRYLALATETSPYPWDAGTVWSLGALYTRSWLPRTVNLKIPWSGQGVVYDVYEQATIDLRVSGGTASLSVDLRNMPGRLLAIAPGRLGPPGATATIEEDRIVASVVIRDQLGQPMAARVPIRLRLRSSDTILGEFHRLTDENGRLSFEHSLPITSKEYTLEISESLGNQAVLIRAIAPPAPDTLVELRNDVDWERERQIATLLGPPLAKLPWTKAGGEEPSPEALRLLESTLRARGIELVGPVRAPEKPKPGILLVLGRFGAGEVESNTTQNEILDRAKSMGLLGHPLTARQPGPGRGVVTAVFSPRGMNEHAIVILGGDGEGLTRAMKSFAERMRPQSRPGPLSNGGNPGAEPSRTRSDRVIASEPARLPPVFKLSESSGPALTALRVSSDGTHLVVAADGYQKNLALIADETRSARVIRAERVGQGPRLESLAVGVGGKWFGASGREASRIGQGFWLLDARGGEPQVFAAVGDRGRMTHTFAASDQGDAVLTVGEYGAISWFRNQGRADFREGWAVEGWKTFDRLDWPVSEHSNRQPQYHAFIPEGARQALILQGDFTNNGWITPENPCRAWLMKVELSDGAPRWRFLVPISKTLIFPKLFMNRNGSRLVLQVQMGSWGKESFRFFPIDGRTGQVGQPWDSSREPTALAIDDVEGRIALAYRGRLLEVRTVNGELSASRIWPDQPVNLAFGGQRSALFVSDDAGALTRLDKEARAVWRLAVGWKLTLTSWGDRLYAASRDGRLRSWTEDGAPRWTLDLTAALAQENPLRKVGGLLEEPRRVYQSRQAVSPSAASKPMTENRLSNGTATLRLGGTSGWMSNGKIEIASELLVNGQIDDIDVPWLNLDEVFWDATAGRQVWAEITLNNPADELYLTVKEDSQHPESWPTDAVVQVWAPSEQRWNTLARGYGLDAPSHTYLLRSPGMSKIRYVPLGNYFRNLRTCEIELR